jgi:hypothetical protein
MWMFRSATRTPEYKTPDAVTPSENRLISAVTNVGCPCGLPSAVGIDQRPVIPPRSLANRRCLPSGDQPIIVSLLGSAAAGTSRFPSTSRMNTSCWPFLFSPTGASKPRYLPSGEKNSSLAPCQSADLRIRNEPSRTETRPICCVRSLRSNCTAIPVAVR